MTVYIFLALFPVFLGLFFPDMQENRAQKKAYFVLCGAVMLFFMGLRHYSLGSVDTYHYYRRMEYAIFCDTWKEFYDPELYETGFQFFVYALSRVFRNPQWLLVITSLFYIFSAFYFVDRYSEDVPLSITLYVTLGLFTFHLQGMRQAMAMCICLFAYEQAKRKHPLRFLLIVLLASTFHKTALVFILVYGLTRLKLNGKSLFWFSVGAALVISLSSQLVGFANQFFDDKYSGTIESGGYIATAIYFITLAVCWIYYRGREEDKYASLIYVLIVGATTYLMRYIGVGIAERISFYFLFSQIGALPLAVKLFTPRDKPLVKLAITVLATALFAYRLLDSGFSPYKFFWA